MSQSLHAGERAETVHGPFAHVLAAARDTSRRFRVLLPEGTDPRVQAAAVTLSAEPWADVSLVGDLVALPEVRRLTVLPAASFASGEADALEVAAQALAHGEYDMVVAGAVFHSASVLRAGLARLRAVGNVRAVGMAWLDATRTAGSLAMLLDPSTNVVPEPETLAQGVHTAAALFKRVVGRPAHVGLVSWHGQDSSRADAAFFDELTRRITARGLHVVSGGCAQVDALRDASVARMKGIHDATWAPADILVFPNIESANSALKLLERLGGVPTCPFTTGFSRPFLDVSRGATVDAIVAAAASGVLLDELLRIAPTEMSEW